jgi:hypothetical protein
MNRRDLLIGDDTIKLWQVGLWPLIVALYKGIGLFNLIILLVLIFLEVLGSGH